jgi:hypothetical protein
VDTPLNVCEQRDVKGLYKKARQGSIKGRLIFVMNMFVNVWRHRTRAVTARKGGVGGWGC